ncbi:MAG TPA: class I SAM-dependent methyltransferase [Candidatus Agathobaculum merdigallinarum]|nr:class I SAM-dependent methyltransferase [Candidatus Agathobaculum merdigallinarum]
MMENKYDDPVFFEKYAQMDRSRLGLKGAGEWRTLESMLPDFAGRDVLDLGCGYGWHCAYAAEHGAKSVLGVDISEKMLKTAREKHTAPVIEYRHAAMEDVDFADGAFDVILSSLAFHYVADFGALARNIARWLRPVGDFVFSCEHPVFTAEGSQDWYRDAQGSILHFPVDNYYIEGERQAVFLGERVTKYHRTLTTYVNALLDNGLALTGFAEPQPPQEMVDTIPSMADELRRPMMLILAAKKR